MKRAQLATMLWSGVACMALLVAGCASSGDDAAEGDGHAEEGHMEEGGAATASTEGGMEGEHGEMGAEGETMMSDFTLIETTPVAFRTGTKSAQYKGDLAPGEMNDYTVNAEEGDKLNVRLSGPSEATHFVVQGSGGEMTMGGQREWMGEVGTAGQYTVRVYVPADAMTESEKENYAVDIAIE